MEEYKRFISRITNFTKKDFFLERKDFHTNPSVSNKVDKNNCFKKFYGDTITFDLNENDKVKIDSLISKLYEYVPECFCERLKKSELHLTLHDLSSATRFENIKEKIKKNQNKIKEIFDTLKIQPNSIKMRTYCITNILNISLVMVLLPVDQNEYEKISTLYNFIDSIQELNYKFTPHITLGYYNINGFKAESAIKLKKIINEINKNEFKINLNSQDLFYQHFTGMNNYEKIFRLCSY